MEEIITRYLVDIEQFKASLRELEARLAATESRGEKTAKQLGDAFRVQGGAINTLKGRLIQLADARDKSFDPEKIKRYNKIISEGETRLKSLQGEVVKTGNETEKLSGKAGKLGGLLAGAFSVGAVIALGNKIIETTAKFQKFEAVLTNTLGSKSAAQEALKQIQEFAQKTPFSVEELTSSFVKLANQGFKPTAEEMRKLGDVAASQGKSFDQLTEALIDAQVGEFERLKEFGIRAEKQGDQVSFAFKGVKTQVDFTSDAIQNYVLGLGDLQGVSGGMAAISETLGGKISNLGDSFDKLFLALGEASGGILPFVVDGLQTITDDITSIFEKTETLQEKVAKGNKKIFESIKSDYEKFNTEQLAREKKFVDANLKVLLEERKKALDGGNADEIKAANKSVQSEGRRQDAIRAIEKDRAAKADKQRQVEEEKWKKGAEKRNKEAQKKREEDLKNKEDAEEAQLKIERDTEQKALDGMNKTIKANQEKDEEDKKKKKDRSEAEKKLYQEQYNAAKEADEKEAALTAQRIERAQQVAEIGFTVLNTLSQLNRQETDEKVAAIDERTQHELEQNQLLLDTKQISQEQYEANKASIEANADAERRKLLTEQAQNEKELALFQIVVDGALAVIKLLSTGNIIGAIGAGVASAAQFALVASKPIPKFYSGTPFVDLNGNKKGRDTVPAMLHEGERVVTADENAKNWNIYEALRTGKFNDLVYHDYIAPALTAQMKEHEKAKEKDFAQNIVQSILLNQKGLSDLNIVEGLRMTRKQAKENTEVLVKALKTSNKSARKF